MKNRLVNDRYNVIVPDHIADWDAPSEWERQRFLSMEKHLKKGDILYDIGAEQGWQSAIYAQFVGGENMVLIEPDAAAWPNIRQTWEANNLDNPKAVFVGCFGDETDIKEWTSAWPDVAQGALQTSLGYGSLGAGPQMRLDDYVNLTGATPDGITIDVEGAELEVLKGAVDTLNHQIPQVWVSVHPDLMEKNYNSKESELYQYMKKFGYKHEDSGWDGHEQHHRFYT